MVKIRRQISPILGSRRTFEFWGVTARLINRFLAQSRLANEKDFMAGTSDLQDLLPQSEKWKLGVIGATLYFLKDSVWLWPVVFGKFPMVVGSRDLENRLF